MEKFSFIGFSEWAEEAWAFADWAVQ